MASSVPAMAAGNGVGARLAYIPSSTRWLNRRAATAPLQQRRGRVPAMAPPRAEGVNPSVRKEEAKVVDTVQVSELTKPLTAYCRCWRSGTFPLCDGSHVKHNKATGDNVGPLLIKKQ